MPLLAAGIVLAILLAYAGSFHGPFIFDDLPAIVHNDTIRELRLASALAPPLDAAGAIGRPIVNLSFALNYAWGGLDVRGYHATNLALHAAVALLLFGVLRRTLASPVMAAPVAAAAAPLAAAMALLWAVHPLLTESVTFVTQRNEAIVGLFYLSTLYAFTRSTTAPAPLRWRWAAGASCLLGMASKELMASAPLMVLLYDRTFVSGTFAAAWRRHRGLHLGLAATWALLAVLMLGNAQRAGTVGFGLGLSSWDYLLTQCRALVMYLRLAFWPFPLVMDYGTPVERELWPVLPHAILLVALAVLTVVAVWRRPALGFLGAWFFAILAPSSSIVPLTTQTMAEHRMYLPLASVLVLAVAGLHRLAGRAAMPLCVVLATGLGFVTTLRNRDYRSVESIWTDTVEKRPDNARAHLNLGNAVKAEGRIPEAIGHYERAVRLKPDYAEARYNLGSVLLLAGRMDEGLGRLQEALALSPDYEDARLNLALALAKAGRPNEAVPHFERLLPARPLDAGLRYNLGNALLAVDRPREAAALLEGAIRIEPDYAAAHHNLGHALLQLGRVSDAERAFANATRLQPGLADAHFMLGNIRARDGRTAEAASAFAAAARLKPRDVEAHFLLGRTLETLGRAGEARAAYEEALRVEPRFEPARAALARLGGPPRP